MSVMLNEPGLLTDPIPAAQTPVYRTLNETATVYPQVVMLDNFIGVSASTFVTPQWDFTGTNAITMTATAASSMVSYPSYWYQPTAFTGGNITVTQNFTDATGGWFIPQQQWTPEQQAVWSRQREKRDALRRKASKRGRKLLMSLLTEIQLRDYGRTRTFVVAADDGRLFRLRYRKTVEELGFDGKADASHCIHMPSEYCPEDTLIAQKLLLETDVAEFERIANRTTHRVPRTAQGVVLGQVPALAAVQPLRVAA